MHFWFSERLGSVWSVWLGLRLSLVLYVFSNMERFLMSNSEIKWGIMLRGVICGSRCFVLRRCTCFVSSDFVSEHYS